MGRRPCCDKVGLKKGPWTADEDLKLRDVMTQINGTKFCWRAIPERAGLLRCGKSCRLRWTNYLRPGLKNTLLSKEEEKLVIDLHSQFGNKWSKIASHFPGRTDNYIKNYWHNHIKKKLSSRGHDSLSHKSTKKVRKSAEEMHDQHKGKAIEETSLLEEAIIPKDENLDLAMGNLTIDTGFSVDQIPLIQSHEIFMPPLSDNLPSNNCSQSSFPTPSTSTKDVFSSTINLICEKLKSLTYRQSDPCKDYNGNMAYSHGESDFTDWDWLLNGFDIDKINHEMLQPPPGDDSH